MSTTTDAHVATSTVKRFLRTLEERDLERAQRLLSADFTMEFPGGHRFANLTELVSWAAGRYRYARKDYEGFDTCVDGQDIIVYCYGVLSGEWLNGEPFQDVRFIDRFIMRDGKLVDQMVWNDLAEVRPGD